jgi:hypothetical protein
MKTYNSFIFIGISIFISSFSMDLIIKDRNEQNGFSDYHANTIPQGSNPTPGKTGAPGENTCIQCHSGSTLPAAGTVNFSFSGINNEYVPGQTYTITISSTGNSKNGFQMTALNSFDNSAGTFTAGTNTSTINFNSRNYVRHSVSSGINSWTFQWNAPAISDGPITFYYTYNKTNNNNATSGDAIYIGNTQITESIISSSNEVYTDKNNVNVFTNNRNIVIDYVLNTSSSIYYCIQDVNGKQIHYENIGLANTGNHSHTVELTDKYSSGVYLVTLFVDNKPITKKIIIP